MIFIIIILVILILIVKRRKYEHFNNNVEDFINSDFVQETIIGILPDNKKCMNLKKFKKTIKVLIKKIDFIPKSKFIFNIIVSDNRIESFFNKCSNRKNMICKKDIEDFLRKLLKNFL